VAFFSEYTRALTFENSAPGCPCRPSRACVQVISQFKEALPAVGAKVPGVRAGTIGAKHLASSRYVCAHPCAVCAHPCAVCAHPCSVCAHPCAVCAHPCSVCAHPCAVCAHVFCVCASVCGVCASVCGTVSSLPQPESLNLNPKTAWNHEARRSDPGRLNPKP